MNTETRYVSKPRTLTEAVAAAAPPNFSRSLAKIDEPTLGCPVAVQINGRWFVPATGLDTTLDKEWREARPL